MHYLNPHCARCMAQNGELWRNYCRRFLPDKECTDRERELIEIQDVQNLPVDKRGRLIRNLAYKKTWYV